MKENTIKAALAAALGALCAYGIQLLVPVLVLLVVMVLDYITGMAKAEEKPAEEPKADTEQVLYRVQVGAFAVRANADRMLEKLKAAGFTGFVVKGKK